MLGDETDVADTEGVEGPGGGGRRPPGVRHAVADEQNGRAPPVELGHDVAHFCNQAAMRVPTSSTVLGGPDDTKPCGMPG